MRYIYQISHEFIKLQDWITCTVFIKSIQINSCHSAERIPSPPLEVTFTSLSSPFDVLLSWSVHPDDRVTQFEVAEWTAYSHGHWSVVAIVPGNQTQARVKLNPYMTYQFRVTAVNGAGRSDPALTNGTYFTPPGTPVSNPQNVSMVVKDGQVVVQWEVRAVLIWANFILFKGEIVKFQNSV